MAKPQKNILRKINLALQGGGSHGAYTWGVLDRLLEDGRLDIEGISGTSAGAINAAVMLDGFVKGKAEGAREALHAFWYRVSELGQFSPMQPAPFQKLLRQWNLDWSPTYAFFEAFTRLLSPYETNPLNLNPLRDVLEQSIDFPRLRESEEMKIFATATSVTTGQARTFNHHEITADALMASACLPFMFQAVEIEGDHYWDGGYMGNPCIWPLTRNCTADDILIVEINPIVRNQKPTSGMEIINRLNEISFNASLISEMYAIQFINQLLDDHNISTDKYRKLHMHLISSHDAMVKLNASSKLNTSWDFLCHLHHLGREAADRWLEKNFEKIGVESSVDIDAAFLAHRKHQPLKKTGNAVSV